MAYNEKLADRTRALIAITHKNVTEKKMFGGLCFMVNDKMCVGVEMERLMVRFDPAKYRRDNGNGRLQAHGLYRKSDERLCICGYRSTQYKKETGVLDQACIGV